jgi:hypothetical protein
MALRQVPVNVRRAMLDGDTRALRELGHRGGKASGMARTRASRASKPSPKATEALKRLREIELNRELASRAREANEDICPVDD